MPGYGGNAVPFQQGQLVPQGTVRYSEASTASAFRTTQSHGGDAALGVVAQTVSDLLLDEVSGGWFMYQPESMPLMSSPGSDGDSLRVAAVWLVAIALWLGSLGGSSVRRASSSDLPICATYENTRCEQNARSECRRVLWLAAVVPRLFR